MQLHIECKLSPESQALFSEPGANNRLERMLVLLLVACHQFGNLSNCKLHTRAESVNRASCDVTSDGAQ